MAIDRFSRHESVHRQAFAHYLRTGRRLTNAEWLAEHEHKFNPYHDEIGRFTSPPGTTVSWGQHSPTSHATSPSGQSRPRVGASPSPRHSRAAPKRIRASPAPSKPEVRAGFRSDLVRNAVSPQTANADTYFELNKRQAYLNRLRAEAGSNPDPIVKADLEDFQRRLDTDRARLEDIRRKVVDPATTDILRAGLTPVDTAAGAINIARGEGELQDYLAVVSAVPLGKGAGVVAKVAEGALRPAAREVIQLGGAYRVVRKIRGYHGHHIPPKSVSRLPKNEGPSIAMLPSDHRLTLSYGRGAESVVHRKAQADLIAKGEFRKAQQMDIDDIRAKFGTRYDSAIEQMLDYSSRLGKR